MTEQTAENIADSSPRERIETDIVIVGAGPAGLAAAIRLKQVAAGKGADIAVTIVEKSAEIGGHVLSGAVMDPSGLDALLPGWRNEGAPVGPRVISENTHFLTASHDLVLPGLLMPPQTKTRESYVLSLGELSRWLAERAEVLGVDIFPATAAIDVLFEPDGAVAGIVTGDLGRNSEGGPKPGFARGIELRARYTLIAEGARGSLTKRLTARFGLDAQSQPQKYGLGIKEIWEIPPQKHRPGRIDNYLGFPLGLSTNGGGFVYHADNNRLYVGLVTHLNYANPTLSPFGEFQRFKSHPAIADQLAGGTRLAYGARALSSGGWQSVPELGFPGGALIGCAAGFMNLARLKGIHNAIRSGHIAAELAAEAVLEGRANDKLAGLRAKVMGSGIEADLKPVRNLKPLWSRFGTLLGMALGGAEMWTSALLGGLSLGTLGHDGPDHARLKPLDKARRRAYSTPDGTLSFDRAASVYLANLVYEPDQPVHLKLKDPDLPVRDNLPRYGEPAPLYCPAGVYELVGQGTRTRFRINAANCVHCKTCDIKDPAQNIVWMPPEGGSGPNYKGM